MLTLRLTVVLLVLALAAGAGAAQPTADTASVEKDLMALRETIRDAMTAKDAIKLRALFADGFTHTNGNGAVEDREAHLTKLLIGEAMIENAGIAEWRMVVHGHDVAVVTARSTLSTKAESRGYAVQWMQIFVRETGAWRIVASQVTRLQ